MDECVSLLRNKYTYGGLDLFFKSSFEQSLTKRNGLEKQTNEFGQTLLHLACLWQNSDAVEVLLRRGGGNELTDHFGHTPFDYAMKNNDRTIIDLIRPKTNNCVGHKRKIKELQNQKCELEKSVKNEKRNRDMTEYSLKQCRDKVEELERSFKAPNRLLEEQLVKNQDLEFRNRSLETENTGLKRTASALRDEVASERVKRIKVEETLVKVTEERDVLKQRWEKGGRDQYRK